MYLLVNSLIKLSMLQCAQLEIYSPPLGWRAAPVKNHWFKLYSTGAQTYSTYEPHIVKSKGQKNRNKKTKNTNLVASYASVTSKCFRNDLQK